MPCFSSFYLGGSELLIPVLKFSPLGIFSRSEYQEKVNAAMHLLLENTVGTVPKTLPGLGCGIQQRSCVSSTYRGFLKLKVKILLQKDRSVSPRGQEPPWVFGFAASLTAPICPTHRDHGLPSLHWGLLWVSRCFHWSLLQNILLSTRNTKN